ncbi:MAG: hypothetical protein KDC44_02415 [Phaeodactylibacter sp.]|nr:hypothetical protein [Phaeodactylibacter sp.]
MEKTTTVLLAKKKLLRTTIIWVSILFTIILIQTLLGENKYKEGEEIKAWIWFSIVALPLLFTILGVFFFYTAKNRCVMTLLLKLTQYLFHIYFVVTLGLLVYQAGSVTLTIVELFERSQFAFLTFQLLLVGMTIFLFIRSKEVDIAELFPEGEVKPLEEIISNLDLDWYDGKTVAEKQQIQHAFASIKDELEDLLKNDEIEDVFPKLVQFLQDHQLQDNDVIGLERQFKRTLRQLNFGRITSADADVKFNNISAALLTILDEIAQP